MQLKLGPLFADILVVSDAPDFVRRIRLVLQAAGYTVRSVNDGPAMLKAVRTSPPDLILHNIMLPGEEGIQLVRQLKSDTHLPFIPIIVGSSQDTPEQVVAAALDAGADEFLYQPGNHAELLTRVRAMLRLKATTDQLAELNTTLEEKVEARSRELEKVYANLYHNEKLAALGRQAASIVHEVNNPLAGILSLVELVQEDVPGDSPVQDDLKLIEQQVNIIAKLMRQLRDFAKPPSKERHPVFLNTVLENVLRLVAKELEKRRIVVVSQLNDCLLPVMASAEQLGEVFLNLILNAQDAMPDGGTLTICSCQSAKDDCIEVEISDSGAGMTPEILDRIFEPFFTTKGKHGTGLGLAISHRIVQDHGGSISVDSRPGQGTSFVIQLPQLDS